MTGWHRGKIVLLAGVILWSGCAGVRHSPSGQADFRIESRQGALHLIPPSLPGGVAGSPVPFSQMIATQYGFNSREQYVDLSQDMRLSILRMTGPASTENSYYGIDAAGRRGYRMRSLSPDADAFTAHAKYVRLFYQTKFNKSPGQPIRPALFLWSDSSERLKARTAEARDNPDLPCDEHDCRSFPGKTTVSPEVRIVVNQKPRYVLLGSSVRDVLRTDKVAESTDIRVSRRYRNRMVPVTWEQKAHILALPLVAGDEMAWQ